MGIWDIGPDLTATPRGPAPESDFPGGSGSTHTNDQGFDPVEAVNALGAVWSPDFDAYAEGRLGASQVRCALCTSAPCACPEFGTPEYFELIDRRHGRR
ncbi:hypothetical protein [Parafrankia sp. FMc2]|uniref:hypothetical protein n=1 Tax=Parafrankia sp. FMc2 TaxID=3233196 RepID=UPI0034D3D865